MLLYGLYQVPCKLYGMQSDECSPNNFEYDLLPWLCTGFKPAGIKGQQYVYTFCTDDLCTYRYHLFVFGTKQQANMRNDINVNCCKMFRHILFPRIPPPCLLNRFHNHIFFPLPHFTDATAWFERRKIIILTPSIEDMRGQKWNIQNGCYKKQTVQRSFYVRMPIVHCITYSMSRTV